MTNCTTCHTADLGKAAKDNCWGCHDPTSATNLHNVTKGGLVHKLATNTSIKGGTNPDCAGCHKATDSLGTNSCKTCHGS